MKVTERNSPLQHIPGIDRLVRSEYRTYSGPILPKRLLRAQLVALDRSQKIPGPSISTVAMVEYFGLCDSVWRPK